MLAAFCTEWNKKYIRTLPIYLCFKGMLWEEEIGVSDFLLLISDLLHMCDLIRSNSRLVSPELSGFRQKNVCAVEFNS